MASSSSSPPWIILSRIANVEDPGSGNPLTLTRPPPPQISLLTISPRLLLPEPIAYRNPNDESILTSNNQSIIAVDSSRGFLLFHVILRRATAYQPIAFNFQSKRQVLSTGFVASYIIVDTAANTVYALPDPGMLKDPARVGIIHSSSGTGGYVVAELELIRDKGVLRLKYFESDEGEWVRDRVSFPSAPAPSRFNPDCVLAHDEKLWWVDLSLGLVAWDASTKLPYLSFFDLPPGKRFPCDRAEAPDLGRHRCAAISDGRIRFVDMDTNNQDKDGRRKVSVWTLQSGQEPPTWTLDFETTIENIWSHTSYRSRRLPKRMPVLAFIHPAIPSVIYFFADHHLFSINLRDDMMVHCVDHQPVVRSDLVSSRLFHPIFPGSTAGAPGEFVQMKFPVRLFNELYGHWTEQQGVVITEINEFSGLNGQTIACASRALENWNSKQTTLYEVDFTEPMDSNAFNKRQEFNVQESYFHANFYGKSSAPEYKKQLFFAELKGSVGPENTITVIPLGQDEDSVKDSSAEHICYCCSGLMHPYSEQFVGRVATEMHQHQ